MVDAHTSPPSSPLEIVNTNGTEKKERPPKKATQNDRSAASRVDIDISLNKLHELLQDKWPLYQRIVTDFLCGRATRLEFEQHIQPLKERTHFVRLHNEIMMSLLANSFRDPPPSNAQSQGWSKSRRARVKGADPTVKRLKMEVMGLSNRERKRLKAIPKPDPSYKLRPNSMIETRFAKLPRVPMSAQKINSSQHHNDIIRGFHVPLCTESHSLPDAESLKDRILATALENGLLGGIASQVPELLINGLSVHLRNILTQTLSKIRKSTEPSSSVMTTTTATTATKPEAGGTVSADDLLFTYQLAPHVYVEPAHSIARLMMDHCPDAEWPAPSDRVSVAMMLDSFL